MYPGTGNSLLWKDGTENPILHGICGDLVWSQEETIDLNTYVTSSVKSYIDTSWQWWHNRETITYSVNGDSQTYTICNAKRFDVTKQDIPSQKQGGFTGFDLVWIIPSSNLPTGFIPKVSDIISPQDGGEYVIQNVMQNGWNNWYRVMTRNLVLALGLHDSVTIRRPLYVNSGGTKQTVGFNVLKANIPAKIVEVAGDIADDLLGKRQNRERYEIHSSWAFKWQPGDLMVDQNNQSYQIVGSTTPDTIDSYNLYVVERVK